MKCTVCDHYIERHSGEQARVCLEKVMSKEKAEFAYLSGLIMGWASSLEDPTQVKRVIKDMLEMSKKLADKGGLVVE